MSDLTSHASATTTSSSSPIHTPAETPTPAESSQSLNEAPGNMDYPLIRRAFKQGDHSAYLNGMGVNGGIENRIPHSRERDLPGGANWVVQKFGGTSVGKFGRVIAEDIVA
jgi:hypothetical protein